MGTLPFIYYNYITPTLLFYFEIAKLGYVHKLNSKEVNEILSNNKGYYKEVFDMYSYLMLIMKAVEDQRDFENSRNVRNKTPEKLAKELYDSIMGDTTRISSDTSSILSDKQKGIITIEVTDQDIKRMHEEKQNMVDSFKKQKEEEQKKKNEQLFGKK